jgi:hypothetical protein
MAKGKEQEREDGDRTEEEKRRARQLREERKAKQQARNG